MSDGAWGPTEVAAYVKRMYEYFETDRSSKTDASEVLELLQRYSKVEVLTKEQFKVVDHYVTMAVNNLEGRNPN